MPAMTEFRYEAVHPRKLSPNDHEILDDLLYDSLQYTFSEVPDKDIGLFVARSARTRRNPNLGVAGRGIKGHQSYLRPLTLLGIDGDGEIAAALPAADNASSHHDAEHPEKDSAVRELVERGAKLLMPFGSIHGKKLIRSRFLWFGQPAFRPDIWDRLAAAEPHEFNVVNGLVYAASLRRNAGQPASAYAFDEELTWKEALRRSGFDPVPDSLEPVEPFRGTHATHYETFRGNDVGKVRHRIEQLEGANIAIAGIHRSVFNIT